MGFCTPRRTVMGFKRKKERRREREREREREGESVDDRRVEHHTVL